MLKCCFTSTDTVGLLGTGAQDVRLDFHTAPEPSKKDAPQWHIYPTFQAHSVTQVCTGIRQNQYLFKTGHSPLIWKLVQHINYNKDKYAHLQASE